MELMLGNNIDLLKTLEDNSIDAIVTDPPYALIGSGKGGFMGKEWDSKLPDIETWKECFRVMKPGAHLLVFGGTRTFHRLVVSIEDVGFEIRDTIIWCYSTGFPKNLDIGKSVDKLQGNERKVVGKKKGQGNIPNDRGKWGLKPNTDIIVDEGNSEWEGWGTALKPALEPITLARKPLSEKTVAQNVLKWGTGAINIDKSRIPVDPEVDDMLRETTRVGRQKGSDWEKNSGFKNENNKFTGVPEEGRWPANFIHDGSEEVTSLFPYSKSGAMKKAYKYTNNGYSLGKPTGETKQIHDANEGSASRFFYCAKVSSKERNEGLDDLEDKMVGMSNGAQIHGEGYDKGQGIGLNVVKSMKNHHPTVKPIKLMSYLCNLITPPNGIVLDPFMGSGSTGIAAIKEGFDFIGMEMDEQYFEIAIKRIEHHMEKTEVKEKVKKDKKALGLFFKE
jgi:DNA modification methylase